jgi:hypothetical protein
VFLGLILLLSAPSRSGIATTSRAGLGQNPAADQGQALRELLTRPQPRPLSVLPPAGDGPDHKLLDSLSPRSMVNRGNPSTPAKDALSSGHSARPVQQYPGRSPSMETTLTDAGPGPDQRPAGNTAGSQAAVDARAGALADNRFEETQEIPIQVNPEANALAFDRAGGGVGFEQTHSDHAASSAKDEHPAPTSAEYQHDLELGFPQRDWINRYQQQLSG